MFLSRTGLVKKVGRKEERKEYTVATRTGLLETDLDTHDREHVDLKSEMKAMRGVLVGILAATATASILPAINIIVQLSSSGPTPGP